MVRLFTALDIPDNTRLELARLRPGGDFVVLQEHPHITLHYIGLVSPALALDITRALNDISVSAFRQQIEGVGVFTRNKEPYTLWAGCEPGEGLLALHGAIARCLEELGVSLESRLFTPHITLARLKRPSKNWLNAYTLEHADFHSHFCAKRFALFASEAVNQQSVYRTLQEYELEQ